MSSSSCLPGLLFELSYSSALQHRTCLCTVDQVILFPVLFVSMSVSARSECERGHLGGVLCPLTNRYFKLSFMFATFVQRSGCMLGLVPLVAASLGMLLPLCWVMAAEAVLLFAIFILKWELVPWKPCVLCQCRGLSTVAWGNNVHWVELSRPIYAFGH